jgi:hypothetical protein
MTSEEPTAGVLRGGPARAVVLGFLRRHRPLIVVLGLIALAAAVSHYAGNKITVYGGLGWDGSQYGHYVLRFSDLLTDRSFDAWYVQRLLPSGMVWGILRVLGKPLTIPYVITGFEILNTMMLMVSAVLWSRIARLVSLSLRGTWVGYGALFINFAVLKMNFYYPVLTDTTALTVGLVLLYGYLADRPILLYLGWIAGAFVFPSLVLIGALLFAFPRGGPTEEPHEKRGWVSAALGLITLGFVVLGLLTNRDDGAVLDPIDRALRVIGILATIAFLLAALRPLLKASPTLAPPLRVLRALSFSRLAILAVGAVVIFWAYGALSANGQQAVPTTPLDYLENMYFFSHFNWWLEPLPLVFGVAHLAYFGPALALMGARWKEMCAVLGRLGVGMSLVALLSIVMAINSESRQLLPMYPFFVLPLAIALDKAKFTPGVAAVVVGTALVASKFWLWIPDFGPDTAQSWPAQGYFMNQGPWMSHASYTLHLTTALACAALIWTVARIRAAPGKNAR